MAEELNLLDVIALTEAIPQEHLRRGEVGTVVESLAPGVWLVEFSDHGGRTYAILPLRNEQMMLLHFEPAASIA